MPPKKSIEESTIDSFLTKLTKPIDFDQQKHDSESRFEITKLFLWFYFGSLGLGFLFCGIYNPIVAIVNFECEATIPFLDLANIISLLTTALGSSMGFIIGYYFKGKNDKGK